MAKKVKKASLAQKSQASKKKPGASRAKVNKKSTQKAKPKRKVLLRRKTSLRSSMNPPEFSEGAQKTKIRVIGIGGGGGNIIAEIASRGLRADFLAANTDTQALKEIPRKVKSFSFGQELTKGLGCGMDVELGEMAARAEKDRIRRIFEGQDITIIVGSLGGGTGSGAIPVFAEIAKEFKTLTLGIFTMPFSFEGERRKQIALHSLQTVHPYLNAYVVNPNEKIFQIIEKETSIRDSFSAVNKRLAATLEGFIDTISTPGLINIDFADVRATLEGRGRLAYINSATASGTAKVQQALDDVLLSPISDHKIEGVDRILFNITGDRNLKMQEGAEISRAISDYNPRAKIFFGISCVPKFKEKLRITLFAVGCKTVQEVKSKSGERSMKEEIAEEILPQKKKGVSERKEDKTPDQQKPQGKTKQQRGKRKPRPEKKPEKPKRPELPGDKDHVRRNALDVRKAVDEEMQELQEKERKWDIPAFLRNRSST